MSQRPTAVHIPTPCSQPWAAMTPTSDGRHCAACQTEVVDFTRMTQGEVIDYLAVRDGQRVCARLVTPVLPKHPKRPKGLRRWLLAVAVLLGWQPASALELPPQPLPRTALQLMNKRITIRGVVLYDSLNMPIKGAYVFIKGTKYGAITNEQGEFIFSFSANWSLAKKGELLLSISAGDFFFQEQIVTVSFINTSTPPQAVVRLHILPQFTVGKAKLIKPPVPPPGSAKD